MVNRRATDGNQKGNLDFCKAFDIVPYHILISELES